MGFFSKKKKETKFINPNEVYNTETFVYQSVPKEEQSSYNNNQYNQNNEYYEDGQGYQNIQNSQYNLGSQNNQYYQENQNYEEYPNPQNYNENQYNETYQNYQVNNDNQNYQYNQYYSENQSNQKNINYESYQVLQDNNNQNYEYYQNYQEDQNEILDNNDEMEILEEQSEENQLDPLNNSNNPIPVNPIVSEKIKNDEENINVKANLFCVIGIIIGIILSPGSTIVNNIKKYKKTSKIVKLILWLTILTSIITIIVRVVVVSFTKTFNAITGDYHLIFDFSNTFEINNYLQYLFIACFMSSISVFIISLIYYASSFFNSKGVPFSSYLIVSMISLIPLVIGITILMPLLGIISEYLSIVALIITFIYSLQCLIVGINQILSFRSPTSQIYYNVFNLSLILIIFFVIFIIALHINIVTMPNLVL